MTSSKESGGLGGFVRENDLSVRGSFLYHQSEIDPDFSFRQEIDVRGRRFRYVENPVNIVSAELLVDPDFLNDFFQGKGYVVQAPCPLIKEDGTTLFTCAGVQILDSVIHQEKEIPKTPLFVSQPVLRTQYIDGIEEGSSTSFINIATCQVNVDYDQHIQNLQTWLKLFEQLGLKREDLYFVNQIEEQKWGDKEIVANKIFVVYDGLEIGDASYVPAVTQKNRPDLSISDIGFGLERIMWILKGGSFFDALGHGRQDQNLSGVASACAHTLALLAGEGLKPSNKSHGYRFRLFSKKLVSDMVGLHSEVIPQVVDYYRYWKKWAKLPSSEEELVRVVSKENTRNFNRILLDRLSEWYDDINLDINQPTPVVLKRLRGTSTEPECLSRCLDELKYQHEQTN